MLKPNQFPLNSTGLNITYHRTREGPNYFVCNYKQSCVLRQDPKDAWRVLGVAKFTDSGKALKEWCLEMHQKYVLDKLEAVPDTSFASEVQAEEDPTANTKMIT